jgi:lipopolysaccharide transport system permease protein
MALSSAHDRPAARDTAPVSDRTLVAVPGRKRVRLADLWTSREVAWMLAGRDLKIKYKQSLLGPPWLVLQPLGVLAGLIVAFNGVADVNTGGVPYVPFALTGLTVWTLVQMTLLNGTQSFIQNALLVRRTATPRVAFVSSTVLSNLIAPAVILAGVFVALLATGQGLPTQALLLPLVLLWAIAFTFFLVCVFASLTVRFRDVLTLLPFWSQAGLFLTPVGYGLASAPGRVEDVLTFNPLTGLLELTRWCLLDTELTTLPLVVSAVFSVVLFWGGWQLFARMETEFADVI